ncbi:hypothetical protein [Sporosarcina sp. ACRSL]|uniref:hypothetical protein n=1 Tax=Sporosarcina sp. ACRSL TaxID=2918215 RepID=UPI001EF66E23|nr:hypothetical protein [Sporosarcina sp. ACRSL]
MQRDVLATLRFCSQKPFFVTASAERCARNASLLLAKAVLRNGYCKDVLATLRFCSQKPFFVTAFA